MPTYHSPGVYVEEVSSGSRPIEGVGTAVCAFVGFTERGVPNQPTLVTNWTQYSKAFGGFVDGAHLPQSVYGYFLNGGGAAYVVRIGATDADTGEHASADGRVDGDGTPLGSAARGELPAAGDGDRPALRARALAIGEGGNELAVEVADASDPGEELFKLIVSQDGREAEVFDNLSLRRGPRQAATVVKEASRLISLDEVKGASALVPVKGARVALSGGVSSSPALVPQGPAPARISPADYVGDTADRTGFAGLEAIENVTMLCVPDLMAAYQRGAVDLEGVKAVQLAMIAHCELMAERVAILDPRPDDPRTCPGGSCGQPCATAATARPRPAADRRRPGRARRRRVADPWRGRLRRAGPPRPGGRGRGTGAWCARLHPGRRGVPARRRGTARPTGRARPARARTHPRRPAACPRLRPSR